MVKIKDGGHIYFLGIGGTGMAAVAGLAQKAGYKVTGSDQGIYPPMSTMLEELGIPVRSPYSAENLQAARPDLVVVANALSRGNPEVEALLESGRAYTSFPGLLEEYFLPGRSPVVVAGTHGKTTTSSIMAHVLVFLGEDPGYFIGGLPKNFEHSFHPGSGAPFVLEGDEYDTAFFDKNSKFLHYRPRHLILNNLEFDHADIFKDLAAIESQFENLLQLVEQPTRVVVNIDDPGILKLAERVLGAGTFTRVSATGNGTASVRVVDSFPLQQDSLPATRIRLHTRLWGDLGLETGLTGRHNLANIAQVVACLENLCESDDLQQQPSASAVTEAIRSFRGVARRMDHLGRVGHTDIFEDFAHHPTAVGLVIDGFRKAWPDRRLCVAFDPRNATSRRNIFTDEYARALGKADRIYIGVCPTDERIPADQRMNTTAMAAKIGTRATAFQDNEELLSQMGDETTDGDGIIFMSSGSFSGIQYRLENLLQKKFSLPKIE